VKKVAKLVLFDKDDYYLLLYRSDHPTFGNDPDLPGGTLEEGESTVETVIREAQEETGIVVPEVEELYAGLEYSIHGTHKSLFLARVADRPDVQLSWEHESFEWLPRDEFLQKALHANDSYMHMVHAVLSKRL